MKCEYMMIVHGEGQACEYKVSRSGKSSKIISKAFACEEHTLEWKELSGIIIEKLQ